MAVLYPSGIICTINRPLDEKMNVVSVFERDQIPASQRYRGMIVTVRNSGTTPPQVYWLPSDDLTNDGWEEFAVGGNNEAKDGREIELRENIANIQWRYAGADGWINLFDLSAIVYISDVQVDGVSVIGLDKTANIDLSGKIDIDQGVDNYGKVLGVGVDGKITLMDAPQPVIVVDGSLTGDGTLSNPLSVRISNADNNSLKKNDDGLFVPSLKIIKDIDGGDDDDDDDDNPIIIDPPHPPISL